MNVTLGGVDYLGLPCVTGGGVLFPLGTFPPGTYTVMFQAVHFTPGVGTYPLLMTQFTVGGAPAAVPALDTWATMILSLMVLAAVARRSLLQGDQ